MHIKAGSCHHRDAFAVISGSGSIMPTYTDFIPDAINAAAQDGVRPWYEQGSNVTKAMTSDGSPTRLQSCDKAIASACGPPGSFVKPRAIIVSARTRTHPTGGLSMQMDTAFLPSSMAACMKRFIKDGDMHHLS